MNVHIVIESPRGRASYESPSATIDALKAIGDWLRRETNGCRSITVAVHAAGEDCDHETPKTG